jgi:hypothetical protein
VDSAVPSKDPATRAIVARIAAAERWGRETDRTAATAPMRKGLRAKWATEADPEGTLTAAAEGGDVQATAELERRTDHLQRAHMLRMSLAAKAARLAGGPGGA